MLPVTRSVRHSSVRRRFGSILGLTAVLLGTSASRAEGPPPQPINHTVQALFDLAVRELERGNLASACPKLEQIVAAYPDGAGALLLLGECYEKSVRIASALAVYGKAKKAAQAQGRKGRVLEAEGRIRTIELEVSTLRVCLVETADPSAELWVDGRRLLLDDWCVPFPIDGGNHRVRLVSARRDTSQWVFVPPRRGERTVRFDPEPQTPADPPQSTSGTGEVVGLVGVGLGIAGVVTAGVLGGLYVDAHRQQEARCFVRCDDWSEVDALGTASLVTLGASAVVGGVGVVLVLQGDEPRAPASAGLSLPAGSLQVRGRW